MNICVYAASGKELDREYYEAARRLGELLAEKGHCLIFGGGQEGLMGACAEGASGRGGEILGIAPRFFDKPGVLYGKCSHFIYTETMRERKQLMEQQADAFIMLPGGIGTFEEFFEIYTLKQLGRHAKPIAIVNTLGYYEPLLMLLRHTAREKFMSEACLELIHVCGDVHEAVEHCEQRQELRGGIDRLN